MLNQDEAALTFLLHCHLFDWMVESPMHQELADCGYFISPEQKDCA